MAVPSTDLKYRDNNGDWRPIKTEVRRLMWREGVRILTPWANELMQRVGDSALERLLPVADVPQLMLPPRLKQRADPDSLRKCVFSPANKRQRAVFSSMVEVQGARTLDPRAQRVRDSALERLSPVVDVPQLRLPPRLKQSADPGSLRKCAFSPANKRQCAVFRAMVGVQG